MAGALPAHRTDTIGICSFDVRRKGQPWPLSLRKVIVGVGCIRPVHDRPGYARVWQMRSLGFCEHPAGVTNRAFV